MKSDSLTDITDLSSHLENSADSTAPGDVSLEAPQQWWYYLIFVASGFTALIYESLWARYVKTILGHAAYAQTLVLVILLFGLALGSVIAARASHRLAYPMLCYAVIEALLALFAVYFHDIFIYFQQLLLNDILVDADQTTGQIIKWSFAAAVILPQTILIGATFPLLAAGMSRRWPQKSGSMIALLYFSNSIGAAVGTLASGFILIPAVGLPGTSLAAGIINAAIAILIWSLGRRFGEIEEPIKPPPPSSARHVEKILLATAAITGMSSFIYEIVWIRFISLLLGASVNSLEIMLAIFIAGLAIGGLLIHRHIDKITSPLPLLAGVQIAMGTFAIISLLSYPIMFEIYASLWSRLAGPQAPLWHGLTGGWLAFLLIFPTAVCAGMTLPLITRRLMDQQGESSIGVVYAANTIGSIAGVLIAVHVLLTAVGVKNAMLIGALCDLLLGCGLFIYAQRGTYTKIAVTITAAVTAVAVLFGNIPLQYAASGVYRHGEAARPNQKIIFYQDGKTASVSVLEIKNNLGRLLSIKTNGKPDAALLYNAESPNAHSTDEMTMVMLGLLPLLARPDATRVANIGFGSGLTSRALLQSPAIQRLDNIEIEPVMVQGAKRLGDKVAPVFSDSRNHFIYDDAKSALVRAPGKYQIIISEPSNPWISGIGGLFTREFYARVKTALSPNGVFIQWLPFYESSPHIVASVVGALEEEFGNFQLYLSGESNVIIVAVAEDVFPEFKDDIFTDAGARDFFAAYGHRQADDARSLFIGDKKYLSPYFHSFRAPVNSDYFPYLEYAAPAAFFRRTNYSWPLTQIIPVPFMEMVGAHDGVVHSLADFPHSPLSANIARASRLIAQLDDPDSDFYNNITRAAAAACDKQSDKETAYMLSLSSLSAELLPFATKQQMMRIWEILSANECVARRLSADDKSIAGIYTKFWRALGLRDGQGVINTTDALWPVVDLREPSGQILALAAMASYFQQGDYFRIISLLNSVPQTNPIIHHAMRFIGALAAQKIG